MSNRSYRGVCSCATRRSGTNGWVGWKGDPGLGREHLVCMIEVVLVHLICVAETFCFHLGASRGWCLGRGWVRVVVVAGRWPTGYYYSPVGNVEKPARRLAMGRVRRLSKRWRDVLVACSQASKRRESRRLSGDGPVQERWMVGRRREMRPIAY